MGAEGLATSVSMVLNTPALMQDALYLPKDLIERAKPMLSQPFSELGPKLDQVDLGFFSRYFKYHGANATPPSRAHGAKILSLPARTCTQALFALLCKRSSLRSNE
jgi:hypothetical protein